jgi:hypothetical protein
MEYSPGLARFAATWEPNYETFCNSNGVVPVFVFAGNRHNPGGVAVILNFFSEACTFLTPEQQSLRQLEISASRLC